MDQASCGEDLVIDEEAEICESCGNVYRIVWLKESDDYNDFGYRHCPFCGLLIDEYALIARKKR